MRRRSSASARQGRHAVLVTARRLLRSPAVRVGGSLLGMLLVLHVVRVSSVLRDARAADVRWLGVGLALTGVSFVAGVVQWGVMLRGVAGAVTWRSLASWQAQSVFAGHVLPSPVAGDAVRAASACRASGGGAGVGSILASRLASGLGMALWGLGGAVALRGVFGVPVLIAAAACVGAAAAGWILVLGVGSTVRGASRTDGSAEHRLVRVLEPVRAVCRAIRGRRVAACVLVATAGWGCQLLALDAFGRAVGVHAPLLVFAVAVPISLLATWAPISVNGLGLREGVMTGVLVHTGVAVGAAGALALIIDVQMVPIAAGGALAWICGRRPAQQAGGERVSV